VSGLEHHSTFLNNCCGAHNRRWFFLSLSLVMLVVLMSSSLTAYEIIGMKVSNDVSRGCGAYAC